MAFVVELNSIPFIVIKNLCNHLDHESGFDNNKWITTRNAELMKYNARFSSTDRIIFEREEFYTLFLVRWS